MSFYPPPIVTAHSGARRRRKNVTFLCKSLSFYPPCYCIFLTGGIKLIPVDSRAAGAIFDYIDYFSRRRRDFLITIIIIEQNLIILFAPKARKFLGTGYEKVPKKSSKKKSHGVCYFAQSPWDAKQTFNCMRPNQLLEPAVHGMVGAGGERTDSHTNPDLNTLVRFSINLTWAGSDCLRTLRLLPVTPTLSRSAQEHARNI